MSHVWKLRRRGRRTSQQESTVGADAQPTADDSSRRFRDDVEALYRLERYALANNLPIAYSVVEVISDLFDRLVRNNSNQLPQDALNFEIALAYVTHATYPIVLYDAATLKDPSTKNALSDNRVTLWNTAAGFVGILLAVGLSLFQSNHSASEALVVPIISLSFGLMGASIYGMSSAFASSIRMAPRMYDLQRAIARLLTGALFGFGLYFLLSSAVVTPKLKASKPEAGYFIALIAGYNTQLAIDFLNQATLAMRTLVGLTGDQPCRPLEIPEPKFRPGGSPHQPQSAATPGEETSTLAAEEQDGSDQPAQSE